ncbi:MAG: zinc-binding dehydrogenase [Eubacterium sp.]|nr:zinc-binding dehydrogenase [Eubacterium sp.]
MKAIVIREPGGPEKLILEERPVPQVREGWSRIQVKGFGVNHSEIFTRKGLSPGVVFPRVLGIECVGIVDETTDPALLPERQKVISIMGEMGRAFDGGYEEYVLLPNEQIYPVETDLPWEVLAAVPETYYTAFGSYQNLMVKEEDRILVRGATSGVGIAFARLVKAAFPDVCLTGSSRSKDKAEALLAAGFDRVVTDKDGILQTEEQYDKALELIGPATLKNTFVHIREGGIVCSTGQLGGVWNLDLEPIMELPPNGYLTSFYSGNVSSGRLNRMLRFIEDHHVNAAPEKVFMLEQTADAHRYLESSRSFGKTVIML